VLAASFDKGRILDLLKLVKEVIPDGARGDAHALQVKIGYVAVAIPKAWEPWTVKNIVLDATQFWLIISWCCFYWREPLLPFEETADPTPKILS
jgi:hypothetical protein